MYGTTFLNSAISGVVGLSCYADPSVRELVRPECNVAQLPVVIRPAFANGLLF